MNHEYRFKKLPSLFEYRWVAVSILLAGFLTFAAASTFFGFSQSSESDIDTYGLYFIAAISWGIPWFVSRIILAKYRAAKEGIPILSVNEDGVEILSWNGKSVAFSWAQIIRLDIDANSEMMFAMENGFSGSIDAKELDADPETIWATIQKYRSKFSAQPLL